MPDLRSPMAAVWNLMRRAGRTDRGRSLAVKMERKPHLVRLKPKCADAYAGKLQVGREYQALFSLENAKYMSIVGTDVTHALKAHFDIRQP